MRWCFPISTTPLRSPAGLPAIVPMPRMSCRTPACGRWLPSSSAVVERPRAWLLTIVRNTAFSWLAKNRPTTVVLTDDPQLLDAATVQRDSAPDPEEALIAAADEAALELAIQALPHLFREVIVMRDINRMSYREIAAAIGAPKEL